MSATLLPHHAPRFYDSIYKILDDYVRFLFHVGQYSLPKAFVRVAKRLENWDRLESPLTPNTLFMMEILLRGYVYAKPLELKRNPELKDGVLYLLTFLVEHGSSAAYQMRDDFVTPIQV